MSKRHAPLMGISYWVDTAAVQADQIHHNAGVSSDDKDFCIY